MKDKAEIISLITDMLQRAGYREARLVYIFLRAMLGNVGLTENALVSEA